MALTRRVAAWSGWLLTPRVRVKTVVANRATVGLLLVGAFTVLVGVWGREDLPHRATIGLFGASAIVLAFAVHRLRCVIPMKGYHLTQLASVLSIAVGVHLYGGGPHALADSWLMALTVASSAFYFSGAAVAVHTAIACVAIVTSLAPLNTSPTDLFSIVVCLAIEALLVWTLARSGDMTGLDPLTRLPDRSSVAQSLHRALESWQYNGAPVVFAVADLDDFAVVNNSQGHAAGDTLLQEVAMTWGAALPEHSVLGRWGGDQFAAVLRCDLRAAEDVVHKLRMTMPGGVAFSAGLVLVQVDDDAEAVMDHAEGALAAAKRGGGGSSCVWVPGTATGRSFLSALAAGEVQVHYQPVIALATGRTTGAEALVRWRRADGSYVPPGDFLPQVEASGAIVDLGRFVLQRACADAALWPLDSDGQALTVAVNATGSELSHPEYAAWVLNACSAATLPPDRLVIEVVEGLLDDQAAVVLDNMHTLRAAGVRLAVDDFGTGWSNLGRLGRLPLSILKIDRSFVATVDQELEAPLCKGVLALAKALNLRLIAEGVETQEQANWLRQHGCQEAQGWLWSPALPASAFTQRLLTPAVADVLEGAVQR